MFSSVLGDNIFFLQRNFIQPGKRPLSFLLPTIVRPSEGMCGTYLCLGASGGDKALSSIMQVKSGHMINNFIMRVETTACSGIDPHGLRGRSVKCRDYTIDLCIHKDLHAQVTISMFVWWEFVACSAYEQQTRFKVKLNNNSFIIDFISL